MSTHTAGPWRCELTSRGQWEVFCASQAIVCRLAKWTPEIDAADARLITAAPDLLAALKAVLRGFDDGVWVRNIERDGEPGWSLRTVPHIKALAEAEAAIAKAESEGLAPARGSAPS